MEKLLFLCRRRPGLDHDEYVEHLLDRHVPLALRHHPLLRRYLVHPVERISENHPEVDSVNELHYAQLEDFLERNYDSPEGQAIIAEDLHRFLGVVHGYATREHVHRDEGPTRREGERTSGLKWICAVRRHLDLDPAAFREAWLERQVPAMLEHQPGVTRLVTDLVESRLTGAGDDWDAFYELSFPARALAEGFYGSTEGEAAVRSGLEALTARRLTLVVAEYPQRLDD